MECMFCGEDVTPRKGLCPVCNLKISSLVSAKDETKTRMGNATMADLEGAEIVIAFESALNETYEFTYTFEDGSLLPQSIDEKIYEENGQMFLRSNNGKTYELTGSFYLEGPRYCDPSGCRTLKDVADLILKQESMVFIVLFWEKVGVDLNSEFKFTLYDESHTRKFTTTKVIANPGREAGMAMIGKLEKKIFSLG